MMNQLIAIMDEKFYHCRHPSEKYGTGNFHRKDTKSVTRCPSNHSLINARDFDDIYHQGHKENNSRHSNLEGHCPEDLEPTDPVVFR